MTTIIDSDQHLFESRTLWTDHVDPGLRQEALRIVDDELGYPWLTWRDRPLDIADVQIPGDTAGLGRRRRESRERVKADYDYDEALPASYWEPAARVRQLDTMGLDEAVLFPNFGLLLGAPPIGVAHRAHRQHGCLESLVRRSRNRWTRKAPPRGAPDFAGPRLASEPIASALSAGGVRLAMIAPAAVDGRPLSHPDHDRLWAAFCEFGITPVFHVADQPRVLDNAFYTDSDESFVPVLESVFLWVPPAIAVTDLIVNGVLARHPELRIGIVELSSVWVPQYLMMLDGGWSFTSALNGSPLSDIEMRPSEYFHRQVRVSSFSYEQPARLAGKSGDLFMCCSDFPHSEGTATPVEDYGRSGCDPDQAPGLFADNVSILLRN